MSSGAAGKEWKNVTVSYNGELCFRACAAGNHDQERQEKEMTEAVLPAYKRFKNWAEEFDTASKEQKKMIACQLFERIELGKGYKITLQMNVTYKQFCSELGTTKEIQGIA